MYKVLRIIFTILSAICIAVVIPVGTLLGFDFAVYVVISAAVFFFAMLHFKQKQEYLEGEQSPTEPDSLNQTEPEPDSTADEKKNPKEN